MLRAASLYIVIVVSLVIAVFSVSLLTAAYFYRLQVADNLRFSKLLVNLESATAISLADTAGSFNREKVSLFDDTNDSVALSKARWGAYSLHTVKTWFIRDTLKRVFLSGADFENDRTAVYLADEDRPLSVAGDTRITGNAVIPKSGIRQAYADGKPYSGKELVTGQVTTSTRTLPPLNAGLISALSADLAPWTGNTATAPLIAARSFYEPDLVIRLGKKNNRLSGVQLQGRVILHADTILTISGDCRLTNAIVYAPAIIIEEGFKGSCQLFARDSIITGPNCVFSYPSCMGVIKPDTSKIQAKISLGTATTLAGALFTFEKKRSPLQTIISLGKEVVVKGEVYAAGYLKLQKQAIVKGKVSCIRFVMQTPATLYENFLIDITLDRRGLNRYYLSAPLFSMAPPGLDVLKWLD